MKSVILFVVPSLMAIANTQKVENHLASLSRIGNAVASQRATDACQNSEWVGDGYCDDETNNAECDWDGGDCCKMSVDTEYCTVCSCIETCEDGIQNQDETKIDCGGVCSACAATETCEDGIQNQDETKIDCGGVCSACGVFHITCVDSNPNGYYDEYGNECGFYDENQNMCGEWDTDQFKAKTMCCGCSGDYSNYGCVDQTNGYTDEADHGCDYYQENRDDCGHFDTIDPSSDQGDKLFSANAMCCACNFNIGNPVSNACKDVLNAAQCQNIKNLGLCDLDSNTAWLCVDTCGFKSNCEKKMEILGMQDCTVAGDKGDGTKQGTCPADFLCYGDGKCA